MTCATCNRDLVWWCGIFVHRITIAEKHEVMRDIQAALTPDLLSPQWRKMVTPRDHATKGHCYAASEALYHLWGRERGYFPCVLRIGSGTHWFLQNKNGAILDPTVKQFAVIPNYADGKRCGFLTGNKPSKRAKLIMSRVEPCK